MAASHFTEWGDPPHPIYLHQGKPARKKRWFPNSPTPHPFPNLLCALPSPPTKMSLNLPGPPLSVPQSHPSPLAHTAGGRGIGGRWDAGQVFGDEFPAGIIILYPQHLSASIKTRASFLLCFVFPKSSLADKGAKERAAHGSKNNWKRGHPSAGPRGMQSSQWPEGQEDQKLGVDQPYSILKLLGVVRAKPHSQGR